MRVPTHVKSNTVRVKKQANSTLFVVTQKGEVLPLKVSQILFISQIQLVVYYQYCVLIGWATSRLYVIAH